MRSTVWLRDDVWDQLDPRAARVSTRDRLRAVVWILVAGAACFALLLLGASGLVIHRFSVSGIAVHGGLRSCDETVRVRNSGWFDERITASQLEPDGTGARLVGAGPATIGSGEVGTWVVDFTGRYCRRVMMFGPPADRLLAAPALLLHLHRPWGTSTVSLALHLREPTTGLSVEW